MLQKVNDLTDELIKERTNEDCFALMKNALQGASRSGAHLEYEAALPGAKQPPVETA